MSWTVLIGLKKYVNRLFFGFSISPEGLYAIVAASLFVIVSVALIKSQSNL